MPDLAAMLKKLRKQNNLTQSQLAKHLDVSQNAVFNWENGKRQPNLAVIEQICNFFHVQPAYLMGYEPELTKPANMLCESIKYTTVVKTKGSDFGEFAILLNQLNETGQKKALEQIELLTKIPEYQN